MPLGTGRIFPYIPEAKYSELSGISNNRRAKSNIVGWLKSNDSYTKSKVENSEKSSAFGAGVLSVVGFIAALKCGKGLVKIFKAIKPSNLFKGLKSVGTKFTAKKAAIKTSTSEMGKKLVDTASSFKTVVTDFGKKIIKKIPLKK